ncbi:hypothetical protein AB0M46_00825 [Dactylosporangium sp. NPDC051485]|uniref:hypothetical protein n=1 Tax=Dactylosporangium sp. NPDC051485 TaxID=3154846 RepID=UPI0034212FAF
MSQELLLVALVDLVPGAVEDGARYEDEVLALLPRHGGTLQRRLTTGATEVQVIAFAARCGYESFMTDPERLAIRERYGDRAPAARVLEVTER